MWRSASFCLEEHRFPILLGTQPVITESGRRAPMRDPPGFRCGLGYLSSGACWKWLMETHPSCWRHASWFPASAVHDKVQSDSDVASAPQPLIKQESVGIVTLTSFLPCYRQSCYPQALSVPVNGCNITANKVKMERRLLWNIEGRRKFTWVGKHMLPAGGGSGTPHLLHKCEVFINELSWELFKIDRKWHTVSNWAMLLF